VESPLYQTVDPNLKVIETLRYDPQAGTSAGFVRLDMHLARAARTCGRLRFAVDERVIRQKLGELAEQTGEGAGPLRCRISLGHTGDVDVSATELPVNPSHWTVSVSPHRLASNDPWLAHKTTRRPIYDAARALMPVDVDEVILLNEFDALCEGSISTIFLQTDADGMLTPALAAGLLPGVLRQHMLETGQAREAHLTLADLRDAPGVLMGNSLRGMIPARLVEN
jgi:4-amino-4-deoxychorismate lyase